MVFESSDSASDASYIEDHVLMLTCIGDKLIYIRLDNINSAMHSRNSVALALHSDTLFPDCAEVPHCCSCSSTAVPSLKVTTEDEDLV